MDLQRALVDFPYYAENQLRIITKDAELVPFKLNRAQRRAWEMIEKKLAADEPVRVYFLKARQLGFSTLVQGIQFWRTATRRYQNALTISHEVVSAEEIFTKSQVFYQHLSEEFRPARQRSNRREILFSKDEPGAKDAGLQSKIAIATAKSDHLGASRTLNILHCSEFARWEDVNPQIRVAWPTLMQTVPRKKDTFVFLETTAWGINLAKEVWDNAKNGFEKFFVSWCADDEYRVDDPLQLWELDDDADGHWGNEKEVFRHVVRELSRWYAERAHDAEWLEREALCRMAWRRAKLSEDFNDDLDMFRQEYPITPEEAFLTTGSNVFDTRILTAYESALEKENKEPERYTYAKDLGVTGGWNKARSGYLKVWEKPRAGCQYVIGVDVGEGITRGDYTAACVFKVPEMRQVAVWEEHIDPNLAANAVYALGEWYNWAYVCVEVNGPGIATNLRLGQELFYPALYYREEFDHEAVKFVKRYGWHTNAKSKVVMISGLRTAVKDRWVRWNDLETIRQMLNYVEVEGKMRAAHGHHDDLVMATALAVQMARQHDFTFEAETGQERRAGDYGTFDWWVRQPDVVPVGGRGEFLIAENESWVR